MITRVAASFQYLNVCYNFKTNGLRNEGSYVKQNLQSQLRCFLTSIFIQVDPLVALKRENNLIQ